MDDIERETAVAALRARRAARGMADPLNRLIAYGEKQEPIIGQPAPHALQSIENKES